MAKAPDKTNVMRLLDQAGIGYVPHFYDPEETKGTSVAALLGQNEECVFKTLVTEANTREHFVFVIPVGESLDLKKAARAAFFRSSVAPTGITNTKCSRVLASVTRVLKTHSSFCPSSAATEVPFVSSGS